MGDHNYEHLFKALFTLFFRTDVSNYCEERKIKLEIDVYQEPITRGEQPGYSLLRLYKNMQKFWLQL